MSRDDNNMWFLNLEKHAVMCCMMHEMKVTMIPSVTSTATPSVPLGRLNLNEAKLEMAWPSCLVMCDVGKLPLAPMPMGTSNVSRWDTFGPTSVVPIPPATMATPAPTATTTTPAVTMATTLVAAPVAAPTMTHVISCAAEFDKGGQHSSSNCGKFQNREQWLKWHCALMGNACDHKCEHVLDPTTHQI